MAQAQHKVISGATRLNKLYLGVPNPVAIGVDGYRCKDLRVETDNGKITTETGTDCSYTVQPQKPGPALISVYDNKTGKLLGKYTYSAINTPHPIVSIGAVGDGGNFSKEELLRQSHLIAYYECTDMGLYPVTQYRITILRNGASIFSKLYESAAISPELHDKFASLLAGDVLLLTNVYCKDIHDNMRTIRLAAAEIAIR